VKRKRVHLEFYRQIFESAPRDLHVVERDRVVRELLVGLVAFPGDHDDVARLGERDCPRDRFGAIGDLLVALGTEAFLDFVDDRFGSSFEDCRM
jgi:hypothetical protein